MEDTKKPILPDWLYEVLKWLCIIVAPASVTLITVLADAWHWEIPVQAITTTITAIAAFIGAIVGISSVQYSKSGVKDNDLATVINTVINTVKVLLNQSSSTNDAIQDVLEGVETSTDVVDELPVINPAPEDEEGKG